MFGTLQMIITPFVCDQNLENTLTSLEEHSEITIC